MAAPKPKRGLSVFWLTLLLLAASLVTTQAISIGLILSLDPPRPDFNRLSDIADRLAGRGTEQSSRDRRLEIRLRPVAPVAAGLIGDPGFSRRLADRIGVPLADVRLFFEPDQRSRFGGGGGGGWRRDDGLVPMRRGEPIFFNRVVAGVRAARGWRVAETPPPPLISPWQRRIALWFGLSALAMLPFAWVFARAIARPIRDFAAAADRLGADPSAPAVPERGPAELRTTAHALNRMQRRLGEYLEERTAMIGAIAHDLRTPLARIAFRIEAAPDPMREKVQGDIEQMRRMIAATIGFVRNTARSGERRPIDLVALIGRLAAQERELGHPVTADAAGGATGPIEIVGDPLALERLFQNLIDNGIAYGDRVTILIAAGRGGAEVIVRDAGPGLPPAMIERAFHPFERGDPSRNRRTGGIGLGLTIARTIAEDHGGTLTLANAAGGGLEARCLFPAAGDGPG